MKDVAKGAEKGAAVDRLRRIVHLHRKAVAEGGMTSGECRECYDRQWPCPTYHLAKFGMREDVCVHNGWCDHEGVPM